jgi:hypothetical protein
VAKETQLVLDLALLAVWPGQVMRLVALGLPCLHLAQLLKTAIWQKLAV